MSNPFKEEAFAKYWSTKSKEVWEQQETIVKDNKPTLDQVVEFVADAETPKQMLDKLYFVYQAEYLTKDIGWSKDPSVNGIGGYLVLDFYEKLLKKLNDEYQRTLFAYLPGDVQENHEDLFLAYLENPGDGSGSPRNYKSENKPSDKVLNWMLDNRIGTIKDWEKSWWTPKLKTKAVAKEPFAIAFIPEDLLTKAEIRNYLKEYGKDNKKYMSQFWKLIPESYKEDPEIFAMWLILAGGLKEHYRNIYTQPFYTKEGMKKYFEMIEANTNYEWQSMPKDWKPFLIDVAFKTSAGAIAIDPEIELTSTMIEKLLDTPMRDNDKAHFAVRLQKMGQLTAQRIEKLELNWWSIDHLYGADKKALVDDTELVIDYLVKNKDKEFLAKKDNWPKKRTLTKEHFIDIIIGLNFSYSKIKARINTRFTEDDFVWLWLEANKWVDKKRIQDDILGKLVKDGYIEKMSQDTIDLLDQMGDDATYEGYKRATDIFIF